MAYSVLMKLKIISKKVDFSKGYECPKCQCKDVNKNGKSNGRQRYICKRCRCTFDEFTLSPFI